jgi:dipeptidyl-peptidase-4
VTERHIYRVSLDDGEIERLTSGPGWHSGVLSPDGKWLIETHQSREQAPIVKLLATDGASATVLFANEGATAEALGLALPELITLPAEDGTELHAMVYAPSNVEPGHRRPVVVSVYGGPHVQRVADDWASTVDLRAQYLSQQGFAVLKVDNRGGFNRGLAFEGALHRNMGSVEVRDQVAAVRWLASNRDFADAGRVGIYGWSYGGYMTLMCMAKAPELFKVGVSGAPVTDWDGYDTAYTERYMGTPRENPDGYRDSSVLTHAGQIEGKLLVVHGMIDENVHFRHTARLLVALASAGKACELLIYPEERHMPRDAKGLEDQERKVLGFLTANL